MAPYVLLSWLAGRMADRMNREICVRASLITRAVLLLATALLLTAGWVEAAVIAAGLTIACGTPAYPAIAAEMPKLAGRDSDEATGLLVTVEVGAFFVGPALGGLALGWGMGDEGVYAAAALTDAGDHRPAVGPLGCCRSQHGALQDDSRPVEALGRLIASSAQARGGLIAVALNNAVDGALSIALLPLAVVAWDSDERAFGLATAALGFGALLAPILLRIWGIGIGAGRRSSLLFGGSLLVLAVSTGLWWAVLPIVVIGAASVHVEAVATTMMQRSVPDNARASLLGLADSVMVGTAAVAAAVTPYFTGLVGARIVVLVCAAGCVAMAIVLQAAKSTVVDQRYLAGAVSPTRR